MSDDVLGDGMLALSAPFRSQVKRYMRDKTRSRVVGSTGEWGESDLPEQVLVVRETPPVLLEPSSNASTESPRTTLLAAITSAGGKRPSQQQGFSSECSWGEVLHIKCCVGWKLHLKVVLLPPPGVAVSPAEQVLLLASPIVVGGASNNKWEEHVLKLAGGAQTYKDVDGLVELWGEFVPLTRTLWRRPALSPNTRYTKTTAEVEFEAYQDYEVLTTFVHGLPLSICWLVIARPCVHRE